MAQMVTKTSGRLVESGDCEGEQAVADPLIRHASHNPSSVSISTRTLVKVS